MEPSLQAKQLKLKRARLADDLNDKISHRPGPIELIHKNILPVPALIGQPSRRNTHLCTKDFLSIWGCFLIQCSHSFSTLHWILSGSPKGEHSSLDEDSSDGLSPDQPGSQDSPLGHAPLHSPSDVHSLNRNPSPTPVLMSAYFSYFSRSTVN